RDEAHVRDGDERRARTIDLEASDEGEERGDGGDERRRGAGQASEQRRRGDGTDRGGGNAMRRIDAGRGDEDRARVGAEPDDVDPIVANEVEQLLALFRIV